MAQSHPRALGAQPLRTAGGHQGPKSGAGLRLAKDRGPGEKKRGPLKMVPLKKVVYICEYDII